MNTITLYHLDCHWSRTLNFALDSGLGVTVHG
jgi:hypothetical protein